jgi:hypothetical protein
MTTHTPNLGRPTTIDSINLTYDALGRVVKQNRSGTYTQLEYSPTGQKMQIKMKLAKYVAALAINIALMQTTYSESLRDPARPTGSHKKYTRAISLGVRTLAVPGLCGVFDAAASSDDFFAQLRRTDEPDGPTFRVNGAVVKNFPDQILVNIKGPVPCPGSSSILLPARVSQQLQEALTFDVHWLNGAEKRPAEKLTFILVQSPFWVLGNRWFYQLQFSGREIPLTATLVVEASTKDGKHLADFTGHL